jgi:RNA polymerase sigma-70 factor, ECF subfamily
MRLLVTPNDGFTDDVRMMARVAAREHLAQRTLAERVMGRIVRLCRLLLRNASETDDAAQNAFLEVLGSAHSYRGETSLEKWVDRVTARTAFRLTREGKRRLSVVEPREALPPDAGREEDPSARLDVAPLMAQLSQVRQQTLHLRFTLGCTIDEIAAWMDTSPNTVKARLRDALHAMRAQARARPEEVA